MELIIVLIVGTFSSVLFLALGYTLGTHSIVKDKVPVKTKNILIDELIVKLKELANDEG